jgi:hypothetical protein
MTVHRTFKFVFDLWNIGNGGGQQPNSGVHEEIRAGRVKAYMGQSNKNGGMTLRAMNIYKLAKMVFSKILYFQTFPMLFPILRQSFINRPTLHGLHFQREKLENEIFFKRPIENI